MRKSVCVIEMVSIFVLCIPESIISTSAFTVHNSLSLTSVSIFHIPSAAFAFTASTVQYRTSSLDYED